MTSVTVTDSVDIAELSRVYREVHAADLHLKDHSDPTVEQRLTWTAEAPGFAATVAYVDDKLAGTVMGCPLPPETLWWRDLASSEPALTREWPGRTFAICEAFVLPEHRSQRLGVPLILELLSSRPEERVTMAVAETNTRVWRALQAVGFTHVGDLVPFPGWRPHRMLVCPLPLSSRR
ncbi:Ribosomal protein S18 acetylase RimI [Asanoa hainanensis]|uniref:Ribosomal protein S18 acetylase RimI n=1 Tax=Asanoa hainanensis TaxID=560556 RepID=A0A239JRL5_9ACTN|nr:GNAT family N-acetyltransferase [Asanoa hainanensis]SNT08455.1 Ribosomal protein S18 acetylase RimI [Asanoa hainanensis]